MVFTSKFKTFEDGYSAIKEVLGLDDVKDEWDAVNRYAFRIGSNGADCEYFGWRYQPHTKDYVFYLYEAVEDWAIDLTNPGREV